MDAEPKLGRELFLLARAVVGLLLALAMYAAAAAGCTYFLTVDGVVTRSAAVPFGIGYAVTILLAAVAGYYRGQKSAKSKAA